MPDPTGRPTLADLIAEIEDDIERADLGPQVEKAVDRAIRRYQPDRFFFNERILTFVTLPGADVYGGGDALDLPDLMAIDFVVLVDGDRSVPLARMPETMTEALDDPASPAQPCRFSYFDRSIRLWPVPCAEWTVRIAAHVRLPAPALDEANAWTDEAGGLIAAWAKRHLALNSLRDPKLAASQTAVVADEERALRSRTSVIASTGQIASHDL